MAQQPHPIAEMEFARSWMLFRVRHHLSFSPSPPQYYGADSFLFTLPFQLAVISQGIVARHARRQASSEQAHVYASKFPLIGELA